MNKFHCIMQSPLGEITLLANELGLAGVWFETHTSKVADLGRYDKDHPILLQTVAQLNEYFNGERTQFSLPLAAAGTPFQQSVWQALTEIPYGRSSSYAKLAAGINNPKAVRAVGAANGKNPISIIVPCHRVIGTSGSLTGYAGGLDRKLWLLKHEGCSLIL